MKHRYIKFVITLQLCILVALCCLYIYRNYGAQFVSAKVGEKEEEYIKWVDFNVPYEALQAAYDWDVSTNGQDVHLNWIDLLAYLAATYGGEFSSYKQSDLDKVANRLISKDSTMEKLTEKLTYFPFYQEAYTAVLGGLVGEYEILLAVTDSGSEPKWEKKYGLKAYSPIAKGYEYQDYDDFGSSRSYGYRRPHLGHDMMGQTGTPIIAIESGYIECIGWNQYGGWRIGIRSFDTKRYYYYAHLRQNFPFNRSLQEGTVVSSGDVIGYMGHTGYSAKENVNNIDETHLHWGLQLIFDESQKEGNNEIWVDCYDLTRFLSQNRSETRKNQETKEYNRIHKFRDLSIPEELKGNMVDE